MSRARVGAALLALAAVIASPGAFAKRAPLPAECRQPLIAQCAGNAAEQRRACLRRVVQTLPDSCRRAVSDAQAARAPALAANTRLLSFGADARQKLDLVPAAGTAKAPLLLFVHGGGWSMGDKRHRAEPKAAHFTRQGWAFASTNYRLVPQVTVEQQAADVAAAIALLRRQPEVDPDRIVIMGHSAGAHLVALLGTDPAYLRAAGVPLAAVRGVIALDGAGYDVPTQIDEPRNQVRAIYAKAFGRDPVRQAKLSPTLQAAAPNVARWLILPVASRDDSTEQSESLAAALRRAGVSAEVRPQPGKTHMTLNRDLGAPGDESTAVVDRFLASLR